MRFIHSSNRLDSFVRYRSAPNHMETRTGGKRECTHSALYSVREFPVEQQKKRALIRVVDLGYYFVEGRIAHRFKKGGRHIAVSVRCMHTECEERETHPSCDVENTANFFSFLF